MAVQAVRHDVSAVARKQARALGERLGPRAVPLSIVVLAHVAMIAVLATQQIRSDATISPTPIQVRMIEEVRTPRQPLSPPPAVELPSRQIEISPPAPIVMELSPLQSSKAITVTARAPTAAPSDATAPPAQDTPPRFDASYLNNPPPAYPPVSRRLREEGTVLLRVRVTAGGEPAQVLIEQSSRFARLDHAARTTVLRWRFVPARTAAGPTDAWVLVPIEFALRR